MAAASSSMSISSLNRVNGISICFPCASVMYCGNTHFPVFSLAFIGFSIYTKRTASLSSGPAFALKEGEKIMTFDKDSLSVEVPNSRYTNCLVTLMSSDSTNYLPFSYRSIEFRSACTSFPLPSLNSGIPNPPNNYSSCPNQSEFHYTPYFVCPYPWTAVLEGCE